MRVCSFLHLEKEILFFSISPTPHSLFLISLSLKFLSFSFLWLLIPCLFVIFPSIIDFSLSLPSIRMSISFHHIFLCSHHSRLQLSTCSNFLKSNIVSLHDMGRLNLLRECSLVFTQWRNVSNTGQKCLAGSTSSRKFYFQFYWQPWVLWLSDLQDQEVADFEMYRFS